MLKCSDISQNAEFSQRIPGKLWNIPHPDFRKPDLVEIPHSAEYVYHLVKYHNAVF